MRMIMFLPMLAASLALASEFHSDSCLGQEILTEPMVVLANSGSIDDKTAVMFHVTIAEDDFDWYAFGFPSGIGFEIFIVLRDLQVLNYWASGNDREPMLKNSTSFEVAFVEEPKSLVAFYRKTSLHDPETNDIILDKTIMMEYAAGDGVVGTGSWWQNATIREGTNVFINECRKPSNPLDSAGTEPLTLAEGEAFVLELYTGTLTLNGNSDVAGFELRLTVNESLMPRLDWSSGAWAGITFPGEMTNADMYLTNGRDYLGNFWSLTEATPTAKPDNESSLVYSDLDFEEDVFIARFVRKFATENIRTFSLPLGEPVDFGIAFGPGNPDPEEDDAFQKHTEVHGNMTFTLESIQTVAPKTQAPVTEAPPIGFIPNASCTTKYPLTISVPAESTTSTSGWTAHTTWEFGMVGEERAVRFHVSLPAEWSTGAYYFSMGFTNRTTETMTETDMFVVLMILDAWYVSDAWSTAEGVEPSEDALLNGQLNYRLEGVSTTETGITLVFWRLVNTGDKYDAVFDDVSHVNWAAGPLNVNSTSTTVGTGAILRHFRHGVEDATFVCAEPSPSSGSSDKGKIAGIVVGVLAGIILLLVGGFCFVTRRQATLKSEGLINDTAE